MWLRIEPWPKRRCADDPDVYGMLLEGRIDVVTFTSASAVRSFAQDLRGRSVRGPAQEHGGGRHRAVDGGGGAPARYRSDGSAVDLYDSGARDAIAAHVSHAADSAQDLAGSSGPFVFMARSGDMAVKTASRLIACAPASAAAADRSDPQSRARDAPDARLLHLSPLRLRRRRASGARFRRCRACSSCRWMRR